MTIPLKRTLRSRNEGTPPSLPLPTLLNFLPPTFTEAAGGASPARMNRAPPL